MNIPKVRISEIYDSIQGEGLLVGSYTRFVRFQGCHVGCRWCDTKYSWSDRKGSEIGALELYNTIIDKLKINQWICITGGEPLEQYVSLYWLVEKLSKKDFNNIIIETSGTPIQDVIQIIDFNEFNNLFLSISPKLPSAFKSFNSDLFIQTVDNWYKYIDKKYMLQFKFVISSEDDLAFLDFFFDQHEYLDVHKYIQIEESKMNDKNFIEKSLLFIKNHTDFKLGLQYHKFLELK